MLRVYTVFLDFSLRHALLMSLTPLILIGVTVFLFGAVKKGAFPPQDTGLIWGRANSSATVSFEDMVARQRRITDMLMADPAVKTVGVRLGSGRQGSSAQFNIELKSRSDGRRETTAHALARLSAKADRYPDLQLRLRAIQDLPSNDGGGSSQGAQYRISLQGNDLAALQEWLPKLQAELKKNPKLRDVGTDVDNAGLRQNIQIDRAKAARLGITVGAIDGALYGAFGQRQISTIFTELNQYRVVLEVAPEFRTSTALMEQLAVASNGAGALTGTNATSFGQVTSSNSSTATGIGAQNTGITVGAGNIIPLSALAEGKVSSAPRGVSHQQQLPAVTVSFNVAPGYSLSEAVRAIQETKDSLDMPTHLHAEFIGKAAEFTGSQTDVVWLLLASLVVIYIVLGVLYESYIHPITIISTLPPAGVGALLALMLRTAS
ncbi:hypothetical protein G6F24_013372 [Rhizopus arrhizus]|nr:hypothetical protein G6F24_013372 [Rhizopus arrhizus]